MRIPDGLPTLSSGAHDSGTGKACFMEYASLLAGESWSDQPSCTHPVIASMARAVNDRLPGSQRSRLAVLIPSVIGTADDREDEMERRVLSVRLAAWCARQVLHLLGDRTVAERAIAAAEAWADCPCEQHRKDAQSAAAKAAANAANAAANANAAAYAAAAAYADAAAAAYAESSAAPTPSRRRR